MIKRLFVNTGSNVAQLVVNMVVTFIMAPIYLEMLGHHDYGLREVLLAIMGYMGMLDLGMRPTVSRFASLNNARNDREGLLVVYASSLVFMTLVGLCLAAFFVIWSQTYPEILVSQEAGSDGYKYELFLLLIGAQLLFTFPQYVTESYLEGLQLYYLKNIVNIIFTISIGVTSYILITPENGLVLLTTLVAISTAARFLIFGGLLLRPAVNVIYPNLKKFSGPKLREMLFFGFKSFIQGAAYKIDTASDRIVIGAILGPASVPVYSIPNTLVQYVNTLTMTLTHSFMPLFTDLDSRGEQARIKDIYLYSSRLLVSLVLPMGVGVAFIGAPFIDVWMPGQFDSGIVSAIVILLVIHTILPKLNPFESRYLTAINKHGIYAKITPIAALANLIISIWLVFEIGVVGAAIGSVFPAFVVVPIFLKYTCKHLDIGFWYYIKKCITPGLIPLSLMSLTLLFIRLNWMIDDYFDLVGCVVLSAFIYGASYYFLSLTEKDRYYINSWIRKCSNKNVFRE